MRTSVPFFLAGAVLAQAQAPDLEALFNGSDVEAFIRAVKPRAEQGDPLALFLCGKAYHKGKGVERNLQLALAYYHRAAEKDCPRALHNLGLLELEEALDIPAARAHLERALELGLKLPTLYNLGRAYDHKQMMYGDEPGEYVKARDYFYAAYEAGFGPSALDEAMAAAVKAWLAPGQGPGDGPVYRQALRDEAVRLGGLGEKLNRPRCIQNLAAFYVYAKEYDAALPWVRRAAALDQPVALYTLGLMYREGLGLPKDPEAAEEAWERAAALGHDLSANEVNRYWEHRLYALNSRADLERARDRMAVLRDKRPQGTLLLDGPLEAVEQRLKVLEALALATKAGPLPKGPLRLDIRVFDMPEDEGGVPDVNEAWYILVAPASTPPWEVAGKDQLIAEGLLDEQGSPRLDSAAEKRVREALVRGDALLFGWPGQRRLLRWKSRPEGGIVLEVGPAVPY